jgi:hypothetical protein
VLVLVEEVLLALLLVLYLLVVVVEAATLVMAAVRIQTGDLELVAMALALIRTDVGLVDKVFMVVMVQHISVVVAVPELTLLAGAGVQAQLVAMVSLPILITEEMVGVVVIVPF